jgi:hypothetical protein
MEGKGRWKFLMTRKYRGPARQLLRHLAAQFQQAKQEASAKNSSAMGILRISAVPAAAIHSRTALMQNATISALRKRRFQKKGVTQDADEKQKCSKIYFWALQERQARQQKFHAMGQ